MCRPSFQSCHPERAKRAEGSVENHDHATPSTDFSTHSPRSFGRNDTVGTPMGGTGPVPALWASGSAAGSIRTRTRTRARTRDQWCVQGVFRNCRRGIHAALHSNRVIPSEQSEPRDLLRIHDNATQSIDFSTHSPRSFGRNDTVGTPMGGTGPVPALWASGSAAGSIRVQVADEITH
jgi:hypothetical protein